MWILKAFVHGPSHLFICLVCIVLDFEVKYWMMRPLNIQRCSCVRWIIQRCSCVRWIFSAVRVSHQDSKPKERTFTGYTTVWPVRFCTRPTPMLYSTVYVTRIFIYGFHYIRVMQTVMRYSIIWFTFKMYIFYQKIMHYLISKILSSMCFIVLKIVIVQVLTAICNISRSCASKDVSNVHYKMSNCLNNVSL